MKRIFFILLFASLSSQTSLFAQRTCGFELNRTSLIARDPSWAQRLEAQRASLQGVADNYKTQMKGARATIAASPIPVIFHFILNSAQFAQIGGAAGIQQRVDSQIAVLNRDYNRQNSDSIKIPAQWKHLYASVGIQFGLAHTDPNGFGSPGYEISIISSDGFSGTTSDYSDAKHTSAGGLDAWDVTRYMNIWCINFTDLPGLLGLTTWKSETGGTGYPVDEEGICVNYASVGKRASSSDYYIPTGYTTGSSPDYYDQGRTITHEAGHFFEIWHTWGDDGGACPWNGGSDDGLADTPPEGNYHYYNWPDTIPGGTYYDECRYDGGTGGIDTQQSLYGIASHDYMNYVDDIAMFMFTTDQAAVMAAQVAPTGENYSLTQNPTLLNWSAKTAVATVTAENSLNIFPNPTTGIVSIVFDNSADELRQVNVFNMVGQEVLNVMEVQRNGYYSIDLSGMSKGMYFINCTFATGTVTRKILLQ
jgi:type IX secretion system substrate protein